MPTRRGSRSQPKIAGKDRAEEHEKRKTMFFTNEDGEKILFFVPAKEVRLVLRPLIQEHGGEVTYSTKKRDEAIYIVGAEEVISEKDYTAYDIYREDLVHDSVKAKKLLSLEDYKYKPAAPKVNVSTPGRNPFREEEDLMIYTTEKKYNGPKRKLWAALEKKMSNHTASSISTRWARKISKNKEFYEQLLKEYSNGEEQSESDEEVNVDGSETGEDGEMDELDQSLVAAAVEQTTTTPANTKAVAKQTNSNNHQKKRKVRDEEEVEEEDDVEESGQNPVILISQQKRLKQGISYLVKFADGQTAWMVEKEVEEYVDPEVFRAYVDRKNKKEAKRARLEASQESSDDESGDDDDDDAEARISQEDLFAELKSNIENLADDFELSYKQVYAVAHACSGDMRAVREHLMGNQVPLWTSKEDKILSESSQVDANAELAVRHGEMRLLERMEYLNGIEIRAKIRKVPKED